MNKNKLVTRIIFPAIALATPLFAFAQLDTDADLFTNLGDFGNKIIGALIALATIVFIYGIFAYVVAGGDEKKGDRAKVYILWGVIGLALMVSVWAIVNVLVNTLGTGEIESGPTIDLN